MIRGCHSPVPPSEDATLYPLTTWRRSAFKLTSPAPITEFPIVLRPSSEIYPTRRSGSPHSAWRHPHALGLGANRTRGSEHHPPSNPSRLLRCGKFHSCTSDFVLTFASDTRNPDSRWGADVFFPFHPRFPCTCPHCCHRDTDLPWRGFVLSILR